MVGKVLRNREIVKKKSNKYQLPEYNELQPDGISNLIKICDEKIKQYIDKRGKQYGNIERNKRNYFRINLAGGLKNSASRVLILKLISRFVQASSLLSPGPFSRRR
jgi:hypothetical protein